MDAINEFLTQDKILRSSEGKMFTLKQLIVSENDPLKIEEYLSREKSVVVYDKKTKINKTLSKTLKTLSEMHKVDDFVNFQDDFDVIINIFSSKDYVKLVDSIRKECVLVNVLKKGLFDKITEMRIKQSFENLSLLEKEKIAKHISEMINISDTKMIEELVQRTIEKLEKSKTLSALTSVMPKPPLKDHSKIYINIGSFNFADQDKLINIISKESQIPKKEFRRFKIMLFASSFEMNKKFVEKVMAIDKKISLNEKLIRFTLKS